MNPDERQSQSQVPVLAYTDNGIKFDYAAGFFQATEKTVFQHHLGGYDGGWSKWSRDTQKEYSKMLIYTDGITEAVDSRGEMFSEAKLENLLQTHGSEPVETIESNIKTALREYTCDDDITFVVIKRT